MSQTFAFKLLLGGEVVKHITFTNGRGRRELRTSGDEVIGAIVLTPTELRVELDSDAARLLSEAQF